MTVVPIADDGRFDTALRAVLRHEGGFVDDPADPGGATKYGVSLRLLRALERVAGDIDGDGDVDVDDVRALTPETAAAFYKEHFWDRYRYGALHLVIGAKLFDLAVNMGPRPAARCLQRAIRAVSLEPIADDGRIGPVTRAALAACREIHVLQCLRSEAAGHYRALVACNPARDRYLAGWLNRAYD